MGTGNQVQEQSWGRTMSLAFQSIGVIYGDIGTSLLYVYSSTFTDGIQNTKAIPGVLSLIIYTIILLPMLKYVFIVLRANDNGDGGTFALYSLLCRHAKVGMIPNQQSENEESSNYKSPEAPPEASKSLTIGCFPRVKVVHTSTKYAGRVYIPEINYVLMVASVLVTLGFKTTTQIGNAYVLVFVSINLILISKVALEDRFVFCYLEPRGYRMFHCVVRYGYNDVDGEPAEFERQLFAGLADFIRRGHLMLDGEPTETGDEAVSIRHSTEGEVQFVQNAEERSVVYLFGSTILRC
ncbi:hypothetical protein Nepgr_025853 [Nepenthes gracilis]|uniref:K+ potassium transporter integral membrane domain-containing protein n=1 Tax=Nepenthes gracilis TaxID=150966 RepID=A0AAD3T6R6_NEPGR|nr:hypothetical protein Nepgr_025853 [Nepenthes gracilis]